MASARPPRSSPASVSMGMVALTVRGGPINSDWFEAYVRHVLAPTLRPGDMVIMDNLSSHKLGSVKAII